MRDWLALGAALTVCIVTAPYWLFFDEEDPEPHPLSRMTGEAGHD